MYGSYPLRTAKLSSGDWVYVGDRVIFGLYEYKWTGTVEKLYHCYNRYARIKLDSGERVTKMIRLLALAAR